MKILILSQVFWPDTVSTAQHLSDLAFELSEDHEVRVIASRHNYENPKEKYLKKQVINRVDIRRINNTALGKGNILFRLIDFLSFNFLLVKWLFPVNTENTDIMIGLTSPPLVSFIGVFFAKRKKIPFYYWTMDLQPELSISSKLIKERSFSARTFLKMGNYIFKNSRCIIVLDKYMRDYVVRRGVSENKIRVVPVWPVMEKIYEGDRLQNPFRIKNGFGDKVVVMYSGNHSYIHPLDTLLNASLRLREDSRFLFVFIGGGVRKKDVTVFKRKHDLSTIVQMPFQPRDIIHLSLGSADIQVVILGNDQVGYTHPNKIYGSMFIGKPVLYIGPEKSHITDIIGDTDNIMVRHGDIEKLVEALKVFADKSTADRAGIGKLNRQTAFNEFHPDVLKAEMFDAIVNPTLPHALDL